jgi:hypothetical protein
MLMGGQVNPHHLDLVTALGEGQIGGPDLGSSPVLRRHQVPPLAAIDALTGEPVRRRHSDRRYEHRTPGELLHVDVKKLARVPDGGGWRLHGRTEQARGRGRWPGTPPTACASGGC